MLLCHMPFSFLVVHSLDYWQFDTVLSGHVHGGQVRVPFFSLLSNYKIGKEDSLIGADYGPWSKAIYPAVSQEYIIQRIKSER